MLHGVYLYLFVLCEGWRACARCMACVAAVRHACLHPLLLAVLLPLSCCVTDSATRMCAVACVTTHDPLHFGREQSINRSSQSANCEAWHRVCNALMLLAALWLQHYTEPPLVMCCFLCSHCWGPQKRVVWGVLGAQGTAELLL
jgi:hypothetical protein